MPRNNARRLLATAYHEAGHAVACYVLELPFGSVTIVPSGDCLGSCEIPLPKWAMRDELDLDARSLWWVTRRIQVTLAGRLAEREFTGRLNHVGARQDYENAVDFACQLNGSPEQAKALVKWLDVSARQMLQTPRAHVGVEAVATALMERKTLRAEEVRQVIREAIQRAAGQRQAEVLGLAGIRPDGL